MVAMRQAFCGCAITMGTIVRAAGLTIDVTAPPLAVSIVPLPAGPVAEGTPVVFGSIPLPRIAPFDDAVFFALRQTHSVLAYTLVAVVAKLVVVYFQYDAKMAIENARVIPPSPIVRSTYWPAQNFIGRSISISSNLISDVKALIAATCAGNAFTAIERLSNQPAHLAGLHQSRRGGDGVIQLLEDGVTPHDAQRDARPRQPLCLPLRHHPLPAFGPVSLPARAAAG